MDFNLLKNSVISAGIAYIAAVGLLFILGCAAYGFEDPDKFLSLFAVAALVLSAIVCGFAASRLYRENTIACGITAGIIFAFVQFIVSIMLPGEGFGLPVNMAMSISAAGISGLTAHLCRPKAPSPSQARRRMKRSRAGR